MIEVTGYAGKIIRVKDKPRCVNLIERNDGTWLVCSYCGCEKNLGNPHIIEALKVCEEHFTCLPKPRKRGMMRTKGKQQQANV